ncbi:MAG: hypothetical protein ACJA06_002021 [Halocynthiibacter sp.]|jgi:hypothetical protein
MPPAKPCQFRALNLSRITGKIAAITTAKTTAKTTGEITAKITRKIARKPPPNAPPKIRRPKPNPPRASNRAQIIHFAPIRAEKLFKNFKERLQISVNSLN